MLNRSGITKATFTAPRQILANVGFQASVGCIVAQSLVANADANGKKIAKAGTPIVVDFGNLQSPVAAAGTIDESATGQVVTGENITDVQVMAATFKSAVSNVAGTYNFEATVADSTTTWKLGDDTVTLDTYGITVTGTVADGDEIQVVFTASGTTEANAVLLHDVDVTAGNANGTALYLGVVNVNRLDPAVQEMVTCGVNVVGGVSFMRA
jgi:hypothetical protein